MYRQVGRITPPDLPNPIWPLIWNPPGWGSFSSIEELSGYLGGFSPVLAMVVGIKPGGYIPFHTDNPAAENGLDGRTLTRYHLVIATNPQCWNFHDGSWQQLDLGGIYLMDPFKEHASINLGETTRYHLVIDTLSADAGS